MIDPPSCLPLAAAAAAAVVNNGLGLGDKLELRLVELSMAAVLIVNFGPCFVVAAELLEAVVVDVTFEVVDAGVETVAVSIVEGLPPTPPPTTPLWLLLSMRSETSHESGFSLL
jgi:hypothetical protein